MNTNSTKELCDCSKCLARESSILSELDEDSIDIIRGRNVCLTYRHNDIIYKEGQFPSGVYILTSGKAKLSKKGYEGREQIMRFAKTGDILGYRSLFSDEPYNCTATVINGANLCLLPKNVIFNLINKNQFVGIRFMRLLANDVKDAELKMLHIAQKPVRERVAEAILLLKETYGFEEDRQTLNVKLSREDLASIAGTVRETATRLLSEFKDDGIIELSGKKIIISNLSKLIQQANLFD